MASKQLVHLFVLFVGFTSISSSEEIWCDFQQSICSWTQDTGDDFDWSRQCNTTPSLGTGPSNGQGGLQCDRYIFIETSNPRWSGDSARIVSEPLNDIDTHYCLTFWYHMFGVDVASLVVRLATSEGEIGRLIWTESGQKGNEWLIAEKSFTITTEGTVVVIEAVRGSGDRGDIAIDTVTISSSICPSDEDYLTDPPNMTTDEQFESDSLTTDLVTELAGSGDMITDALADVVISCDFQDSICGWTQDTNDEFDWTRSCGSTISLATGPTNGQGSFDCDGYLFIIETSAPRVCRDMARVMSPFIHHKSTTYCLTFWYHMYGNDVYKLVVRATTDPSRLGELIYTKGGNQGDQWHRAERTFNVAGGRFRVVFEATRGRVYLGDTAIDSVKVSTGPCQPDKEQPVLICASDVMSSTDDGEPKVFLKISYPFVFDNSGDSIEATSNLQLPANFSIGLTNVTFTAVDSAGNEASCDVTVTVEDDEAPVLKCPLEISNNTDPEVATAKVTFGLPIVTDNSDEVLTAMCYPDTDVFSIGDTTVTCNATDSAGNTANCSFIVNINDKERPVLICASDEIISTDDGEPKVLFNINYPSVVDNSGESIEAASNLQLPANFCIGLTIVTFTAVDSAGNEASCNVTVTVEDKEQPLLICASDEMISTDDGEPTVLVNISYPSVVDNSGESIEATSNLQLPANFSIGLTIVTFTAVDSAGNEATCNVTVSVDDIEAPVLHCPLDISNNTDPEVGSTHVNFGLPIVIDNSKEVLTAICYPDSDIFGIGDTTVTCNATDFAGNTGNCTFIVTINDNEVPELDCPEDFQKYTDEHSDSAAVYYPPVNVTDNSGDTLIAICDISTVSNITIGNHAISCCATDNSDNKGMCSFVIEIVDKEPPTLTCASDESLSTDYCLPTVLLNVSYPSVVDNSGEDIDATSNMQLPANFSIGLAIVTFTAVDSAGNEASCNVTVSVDDIEAPVLQCPLDISNNTDPEVGSTHVTFGLPIVIDNSKEVLTAICYPYSDIFGIGDTTVTCNATDLAGNMGNCTFIVTINDKEVPELDCPEDFQKYTDEHSDSAAAYYPPVNVTDNSGDTLIASCDISTWSNITIGNHTVSCCATDNSDNKGTCSFVIEIVDKEPPTLTCASDESLSTDDGLPTVLLNISYPSVVDNSGEDIDAMSNMQLPANFSIGLTIVTFTAVDSAGNEASCNVTVSVDDKEPPTLTCASDESLSTDDGLPTVLLNISYPSVVDNSGEDIDATSNMQLPAYFSIGLTIVTFTAVDSAGNEVSCNVTVTVDVSCDFQDSICGWTQDTNDDFDWTRWCGRTYSSGTGPTNGHGSFDCDGYLYIETTPYRVYGAVARVMSPFTLHESTTYCLVFWYHMYGNDVYTLAVRATTDPSRLGGLIYTKVGNQGNQWHRAERTFNVAGGSFRVEFEATRGQSYQGDTAIDSVSVSTGPCQTESDLVSCEFQDSICGWTQDTNDEFDWTRLCGSTRSYATGPTNGQGSFDCDDYLYIETSTPRVYGDIARVMSPFIQHDSTAYCLIFWYHMYGNDVNTLTVRATTDSLQLGGLIYTKVGNQGNQWNRAERTFNVAGGRFRVEFEATRGQSYQGDIAIDSVNISIGPC